MSLSILLMVFGHTMDIYDARPVVTLQNGEWNQLSYHQGMYKIEMNYICEVKNIFRGTTILWRVIIFCR